MSQSEHNVITRCRSDILIRKYLGYYVLQCEYRDVAPVPGLIVDSELRTSSSSTPSWLRLV